MKSKPLFEAMVTAVKAKGPDMVKMGGAVFQFVIKDVPDGAFCLDLKNGSGEAKFGQAEKADVTLTLADDGMQAFMSGKLKVGGNMMLAQKLGPLLEAFKS